ncbi:MAG: hypothetical protein ACRD3F_13835 [Acidobacteriaceae bacterium]
MQPTRRQVMATITSAVAAVAAESLWGQNRSASPQPMPSPNAPLNQNVPAGLDGANIPVVNGRNVVPPATWVEIRKETQKLLEMTQDFKQKVDATNLGSTLPLDLLKQAHRIEKQIKKIERQMKR